tara:strand:- start:684 stop:1187 length:504 start_codon:yes stop_codon:yes gene_type:complete
MKRLLLFLIIIIPTVVVSQSKKEYEKNLDHFKYLINNINTYFIDSSIENIDISNYYTDDFIFHSYPAGHKKGIETSKIDYINRFNQMKKINMSINIGHSIYLPGIDEKSYDMDGSVRVYYGASICIDTNCVDFSGYQTINFQGGKISEIWEWADYGGVSNKISQFIK